MLNKKNRVLQLAQFLALVASLLIVAQIGFTWYQKTPFCLSEGCKVVEQLTRVSPQVFNLVGLLFFQVVFWGLRSARGDMRRVPGVISILLVAALGVEAVLVGFQALVLHTFCIYCLAVFAFVVLLNCLLGGRQLLAGSLVFVTVGLAFAGLDFSRPVAGQQAFTTGVFATRPGLLSYPEHYLFYASTCEHCKKVIAILKTNGRATVHFNPIDRVTAIDLANITTNTSYAPASNKALLAAMGIDEIPVLMTRNPDGWTIRRGEAAIVAALSLPPHTDTAGQSGSSTLPGTQPVIPGLEATDGCQVFSDCPSTAPGSSSDR